MCELEESRLRAVALLDLVFVLHVIFVAIIVVVVYAMVARTTAGSTRRLGGSYEPLPTSMAVDSNHVQMKAMANMQA